MDSLKTPKHGFRIAVVYDWKPESRPNAFGEDMRSDQIRNEVAELLIEFLNQNKGVNAELVAAEYLEEVISRNQEVSWDGAINMAYGEFGRFHMAAVPMMLDRLGIPNYGADPFLMVLARNKQQTKNIAESIGINVSSSVFYDQASAHLIDVMPTTILPAIIKPNEAASGLGIEPKVYETLNEAKLRAHKLIKAYPEGVLVEKFVPGMELTVAALSSGENIDTFAYILKEKNGVDLSENYMSAYQANLESYVDGERIWSSMEQEGLTTLATEAKNVTFNLIQELRFIGYARADFRATTEGELVFLELNGQAGIGLGPSVVTTIGTDYYGDRLGFIKELTNKALYYLKYECSDPSKGHKRWSHQAFLNIDT